VFTVGTTSREGMFTELGPYGPFQDGCSGMRMRQPELMSMRGCRVKCNQVDEIRRKSIILCRMWCISVAILKMMRYLIVQLLPCLSNVRPPVTIDKSSIRILYTLQRRHGRCKKAGEHRIAVESGNGS